MSGWDRLPVDDQGYFSAAEMLAMPTPQLQQLVNTMSVTRYTGWRNHGGLWREMMGLDELTGKDILDFGCGVGLEAMQLACHGNRVTVADITPAAIELARRVCTLFGATADEMLLSEDKPVFPPEYPRRMFDVFYASGSLHHCRFPMLVMDTAHELVRAGGEARLMLYSDRGWTLATGTLAADWPPAGDREKFTRFFDSVGDWAEWYDEDRLRAWFGAQWKIMRFAYLTPDDRYCAAVLRRLP